MDKLRSSLLAFSVLTIPMDLSQWIPVPVKTQALLPAFKTDGHGLWNVTSQKQVGGMGYLLEKPLSLSSQKITVEWKWRAGKFPQPGDDYALRVGVILANLPGKLVLPRVLKDKFKSKKFRISHVLFYVTVPTDSKAQGCVASPQSNQIWNCARKAGSKVEQVSVDVRQDLLNHLEISADQLGGGAVVGLWVFADSDDSSSSSQAEISEIRLIMSEKQ